MKNHVIKAIDIEGLTKDYIFASSAAYVYDRFRENNSVRNLANVKTPDILIKEYKEQIEKAERKIEDVVVAYAVLVGITFLDYSQASSILNKIDLSKLEWGKDIKDRYMRNARPTALVNSKGNKIPMNVVEVEESKAKDSSTSSDSNKWGAKST